jgi:uncharacterized protein
MEQNTSTILSKINPWWVDREFRHDVINRPYYLNRLDTSQKLIDVLLGARRVGKSSIIESLINKLMDSGTDPVQILYLTADNPFLRTMDLAETIQQHIDNIKTRCYVFIDEIQDVDNWQTTLKYFYDNFDVKFVISGSSNLLINEQARKLTGRANIVNIWTLGWDEVALFNKSYSFQDYFDKGGYPEIVLGSNRPDKLVAQIIESTVYRDLTGIYGIQNPKKIMDLLRLLSEKVCSLVSYRSIAKQMDIDDSTAKKLVEYLINIRLVFEVPLSTISTKKALRNPSKYYIADNGIITNIALQSSEGALAENLVAISIQKSAHGTLNSLGYGIKDGVETDFIVNGGNIEVKYRDDWETQIDKETDQKMLVITKSDTLSSHPFITAVPLQEFIK